jgi:hypothetical protein
MAQYGTTPNWSEVKTSSDLKRWLSDATITKTIYGGRAFKTSSDKTGVNLNVVFAKLQKLNQEQQISPVDLKEIINHFLKHDFTPLQGNTREKELYIARFLGNKQTAKRNKALTELISSQSEISAELHENQIISQGLKKALLSIDVKKKDIDDLHKALTQEKATPSSAANAFQRFLKNISLSSLEQDVTTSFCEYLNKHSNNSVYLGGIVEKLSKAPGQQGAVPAETQDSSASRFLEVHASHFPRKARLALSKIQWDNDVVVNNSLINDACTAMADMNPMDIQIFCNQSIAFKNSSTNQSQNFKTLIDTLTKKYQDRFVKDETEYQELACLREGLRTFYSAIGEEDQFDSLYKLFTKPDNPPIAIHQTLPNENTTSAMAAFVEHLKTKGAESQYLQSIARMNDPNSPIPNENPNSDFSVFLKTYAYNFSRRTCRALSKINWDKNVEKNADYFKEVVLSINKSKKKHLKYIDTHVYALKRALESYIEQNKETFPPEKNEVIQQFLQVLLHNAL